jgi:hypothetical protein
MHIESEPRTTAGPNLENVKIESLVNWMLFKVKFFLGRTTSTMFLKRQSTSASIQIKVICATRPERFD